MAFSKDQAAWDEFLQRWPIERLRTMSLAEYTTAGDQECFIYWIEFRLGEFGSIAGGSAFKFGIFSRKSIEEKQGDASLAYDASYGWYRQFGATPEAAFATIRAHVVAVAEAARDGRLEEIDRSPLGAAYRWKIAFHYQNREAPQVLCIYVRRPLLRALDLPLSDTTTPQGTLYRQLAAMRQPEETIVGFSERVWREWIFSQPCVVKLSQGAINNGYLSLNLVSAPFPETMYGGDTDDDAGQLAQFRTDTGESFESDIRVQAGGSGRLRKRLGSYFKEVGAKVGDEITISQDEDGTYLLSSESGPSKHQQDNRKSASGTIKPTPVKANTSHRMVPLNQILYGPPGTGKTYKSVEKALEILDPELLASLQDEDREERRTLLKARFDQLEREGLVQFVTFHQSFSYEDFVEGVQAQTDDSKQLRYDVVDGVFKRLCDVARTRLVQGSEQSLDLGGRRIWKLSLGDAITESHIYEECIRNDYALMGFGADADYSGCNSREDIQGVLSDAKGPVEENDYAVTALNTFIRLVKAGDLVVVTEGNLKFRAIGEVTGEYRHLEGRDDTYSQCRNVRWLRVYSPSLPYEQLMSNRFSQMTIYELRSGSIDFDKLQAILKPAEATAPSASQARVLIIDEINRGNVSRIFGELITLIEDSKRSGQAEALQVTLPYSKTKFSVPDNIYLIGTMNTADRSLTGLDVALRRRFTFVELGPDPGELTGLRIAGVDMDALLETMNRRIEVLLDRDHQLGHAFFMSLRNGDPLASLASIFRHQIIPMLQEYFFEDWERIAWVLNDHRKAPGTRFLVPPTHDIDVLFGSGADVPIHQKLWRIDQTAFDRVESYAGIVSAP